MTRVLKEILIKIATLPRSDQRWILSKLSEKQGLIFQQMRGEQQLEKARYFRRLKTKSERLKLAPLQAPAYPQALAHYPPLYIAIVLEQGNFSWQESFLQNVDQEGAIRTLMNGRVHELKESAKQALFQSSSLGETP